MPIHDPDSAVAGPVVAHKVKVQRSQTMRTAQTQKTEPHTARRVKWTVETAKGARREACSGLSMVQLLQLSDATLFA